MTDAIKELMFAAAAGQHDAEALPSRSFRLVQNGMRVIAKITQIDHRTFTDLWISEETGASTVFPAVVVLNEKEAAEAALSGDPIGYLARMNNYQELVDDRRN